MNEPEPMSFDQWCLRAGALVVMAQTPEAAYVALQAERESGAEPPYRLVRWMAEYAKHGDLSLILAQLVLAGECHRQEKAYYPDRLSTVEEA